MKFRSFLGLAVMFWAFSAGAVTNTLITFGGFWNYLDNGSNQGTNWIMPGFNDSSWASGGAPLGYNTGNSGITTVVSYGGVNSNNNKHITTYFRHVFEENNPEQYTVLILNVRRDDGVAVYLNGVEVFRNNLTNRAAYNSLATNGNDNGTLTFTTTINPLLLVQENNVVAAEIHQTLPTSSDIFFDLELLASTDSTANQRPNVNLTSPANNAFFTAPANITLQANASDPDGTINRVEFYRNDGVKLGEDTTAPYSLTWSNVGTGTYSFYAVATDNLAGRGTSSVANVTVGVSAAPTIASIVPAPGSVSNLTHITVNFSESVDGVQAEDLLINGRPATTLAGSGANYTFGFPLPADGTVFVAWDGAHGIADFEPTPRPFDNYAPGASWQYMLTDRVAPTIAQITPAAGATVQAIDEVEVTFSEPVWGVSVGDLRVNGVPILNVSGSGQGPYRFSFPPVTNTTTVQMSWVPAHGIKDFAGTPNNFAGGSWTYTRDATAVFEGKVVISEIMYHPSSERTSEEYVELHNTGSTAVNLTGWRLNRSVDYTFGNVTLPAGGYIVVAADLTAFALKYSTVPNVVGPWQGILSNTEEEIELEDASGNRVDLVHYADEGEWAERRRSGAFPNGWDWFAEHDGLGKSLELINVALDNSVPKNWASSATAQGTPGQANSVASNNVAPLISELAHFPPVPRSTNQVTITARVLDESPGLTVRLWSRNASGGSPPAFASSAMFDDGAHNDGGANDGIYGIVLAPMGNGTIIEFYVEAVDVGGNTRTCPGPGRELNNSIVQIVNAAFQVDNEVYTGNQPTYRIIMTEPDRSAFAGAGRDDAQWNCTFVTTEGPNEKVRYNGGIRYRGAGSRGRNPATYRLNLPSDRKWNGKSALNLNSQYTHAQLMGAVFSAKAGLPYEDTRIVQLRVNGVNIAGSGSPQFGSYAHVEPLNSEWADNHFPDDGEGNVYRASTGNHSANLRHRGNNPQAYLSAGYSKTSNTSENDWTDLMALTFALDPATTADSDYLAAVRKNANVELFLRYFALLSMLEYTETSIGTGRGDDYGMYRGIIDPRFILLPHDYDTVIGEGDSGFNINESIFVSTFDPQHGVIQNRFLYHPEFEPLYYVELDRLLRTAFETNVAFALLDQHLGGWVPVGTINNMKSFIAARNDAVRAQLPATIPYPVIATVTGEPPSPTYLNGATLRVGGRDITHYMYRVNDGFYGPETPVATPITLNGLVNGTYTVFVLGRNSQGIWQNMNAPTISETWTVISGLANVVITEVLARNDSAVNHSNTFPDMIELFNPQATSIDLSGLRLTDDPDEPNKFTFAPGTSLPAGAYLRLFADDPNGTSGIHLGFSLNQDGEGVFLFDRASNGQRLLDSVIFGRQLADLSIGRLPGGNWGLCIPSLGAANTAAPTGNPATLAINEWQASGIFPFVSDFVEIYNPDALPLDLGGFYLSDQPVGRPRRHKIVPLHFIPGHSYMAFVADGQPDNGALHLNFQLGVEFGEIALFAPDLTLIDCVTYAQQRTGISQGRSPNGREHIVYFDQPTPGVGNPAAPEPEEPILVNLIPIDGTFMWRYEESGADLGTNWRGRTFDDSTWSQGAALLGRVRNGGVFPPEPVRTQLNPIPGKSTFYFRARFTLPPNVDYSGLEVRHIIDDGAVFYINGQEAGSFNLDTRPVTYNTPANGNILDATYGGPQQLSVANLVPGENVIAVEVHQSSQSTGDIMFGIRLDAVVRTNNPATAGILINEVLANNVSPTGADSTEPDWIELFNPSNDQVDLSGMTLSDKLTNSTRWFFPPGSVIPANGYYRVNFDSNSATNATNTGFGLRATGDGVFLFDRPARGGALLDGVTFGIQAADFSLARVPNGSANWVLGLPTLMGPNIAASLGDPRRLRVNEWLADPRPGDPDWFEIYNPEAQPVALGDLFLSDRISNLRLTDIPPRSFIGTGLRGFQVFVAGGDPNAGNFVNFGLSGSGDFIYISDGQGAVIHRLQFFSQAEDVSEGFLPDGNTNAVRRFPVSATPDASNFLPLDSVVINEVLSHTDSPLEDAIELRNLAGTNVNISGWYLSDSVSVLKKFRIPNGTSIAANGFKVFYENQFNPIPGDPGSFALSSAHGDQVHLSAADGAGNLTGHRARVSFGPAENAVAFGRYQTSVDVQFVALQNRTFGMDTPDSLAEFRTGAGSNNAPAKVGPVIISEIMYHPPDINFEDNAVDEFVMLRNISGAPVALFHPDHTTNRWRLRDAMSFTFPPNTTMPANALYYIVSFDPVAAPSTASAFRSKYFVPTNGVLFGPYTGKLENDTASVELVKPDAPEPASSEGPAVVPYVMVDKVKYSDSPPWPIEPDGTGAFLRRISNQAFGNDPANWTFATPQAGEVDTDSDGMPDSWEDQYGLNPLSSADAHLDNDNDGLTNLQEYQAGTNPLLAGSVLRLNISYGPIVLRFDAQANKSYLIEFTPSLSPLDWQPWAIIDAQPNFRNIELPETEPGPRFYRLRTP